MAEFLIQLHNTYLPSLLSAYSWILIIYILMSWVPNVRESQIGIIIGKIAEPYLSIFRQFIPPIGGMLDVSPIVALLVLNYLVTPGALYLVELLYGLVV